MLPSSAMGRPRTIKSPEEFDRLVDGYVAECRMCDQKMDTVSLALYLGFNSKTSLRDYGNREGFEEFAPSVKRARSIVEAGYTQLALNGGGAGPIFLLKAVYGYEDKKTIDVNATGEINVVMSEKDAKL